MLEIGHTQSWKLIKLFADKGENLSKLSKEFGITKKRIEELQRAILPPGFFSFRESVVFLREQQLSVRSIALLLGSTYGKVQHYFYRVPRAQREADQRRKYNRRYRSEIAEIRKQHELSDEAPIRSVGVVQPKVRAAGDPGPIRRPRRIRCGN